MSKFLKKLSKTIRPHYERANWSEIEDDVNLCVFVEKHTNQNINLRQAEELRELLEKDAPAETGVLQSLLPNETQ